VSVANPSRAQAQAASAPAGPSGGPLLSVQGLRVVFRDRRGNENVAVDDFSVDVMPGHTLAIVGESGSGKSVSMRSLLQLLPTTAHVSGKAFFDGQELIGMREDQLQRIRGRRIGMVFQNAMQAFNPTLTLGRQLTEHLAWHRVCGKKEAVARAIDALDRVGIPDPERRMKLYPFQFSGGMLQRAMIALAIVAQPDLLIADEPTTAVDVTLQRQVLDLLASLRDDGLSLIMITHDLGVARYSCQEVLVMQEGRVVERGEMATFAETAANPYSRRLLDAALDVTADERHIVPESAAEELVEAHGLSKVFEGAAGAVLAVDSVDVRVGVGEAVGVVGESGSGKSTLARLLLRLIEPTTGEVTFEDVPLIGADRKRLRDLRRQAQMIFQDPLGSLMPHRTIAENITEPLQIHRIGTAKEQRKKALELLGLVGIPTRRADNYPRQFSGGQQQRIAIARALALEPKLLVCDEPTSALDVSIQAEILALLKDLRERLNLSMLFITHNLAVAQEVSDRIIVMNQGCIVESAPTDELFNRPRHSYTRTLLSAVLPIRGEVPAWEPIERVDLKRQHLLEVAPGHWVRIDPDADPT
jgi:peptide/nickel transport system ATP-binding protein